MQCEPPELIETRVLQSSSAGMPASPVAQSFHALTTCLKRMAHRRAALSAVSLIQDMLQDNLRVAECESSLGRR